jgi:hypothetical protein
MYDSRVKSWHAELCVLQLGDMVFLSPPEDPSWWTAFDADEAGVQEVCRVLAHLYSLPKAQYIPVYKDNDSFTVRRTSDTLSSKVNKEYNSMMGFMEFIYFRKTNTEVFYLSAEKSNKCCCGR